jgi:hypothetical protein
MSWSISNLVWTGDPAPDRYWSGLSFVGNPDFEGHFSGDAYRCSPIDCATTGSIGDAVNLQRQADGLTALEAPIFMNSGNAVWGCDIPFDTDPDIRSGASTCGGSADWRINFGFVDTGLRLTDRSQVTFRYRNEDYFYSEASCTTGADCITVTPEPATIFLMAGGLLGVGVVMRRRRKNATMGENRA